MGRFQSKEEIFKSASKLSPEDTLNISSETPVIDLLNQWVERRVQAELEEKERKQMQLLAALQEQTEEKERMEKLEKEKLMLIQKEWTRNQRLEKLKRQTMERRFFMTPSSAPSSTTTTTPSVHVFHGPSTTTQASIPLSTQVSSLSLSPSSMQPKPLTPSSLCHPSRESLHFNFRRSSADHFLTQRLNQLSKSLPLELVLPSPFAKSTRMDLNDTSFQRFSSSLSMHQKSSLPFESTSTNFPLVGFSTKQKFMIMKPLDTSVSNRNTHSH